jgi:2-polyprenyl-3-methyl-5-hydroxy-6-metoxy-1,4-benzoquinol methylase
VTPETAILAPVEPHDAFTFEELSRSYNFRRTSDRRRIFSRIVVERAQAVAGPDARVLDIGCGRGIGRSMEFLKAIRSSVGEMWGLEPDRSIAHDEAIFDQFQHATMEDAELPAGHFDLAYSFMVMEHVEHPAAFLKKLKTVLRPGGEYVFVTPNSRHYFTRIASLLHTLHLDELMLKVVRRKAESREYHYPVQYRFNNPRQIAELAAKEGFEAPRFAYLEPRGPANYLPGVLKPLYWLLALKRKVIRNPEHLVSMIVILKRPT